MDNNGGGTDVRTLFSKIRIDPSTLSVNTGLGNVDLRGTSFAVAPNQFVAVGWYASGGATYSSDNQMSLDVSRLDSLATTRPQVGREREPSRHPRQRDLPVSPGASALAGTH